MNLTIDENEESDDPLEVIDTHTITNVSEAEASSDRGRREVQHTSVVW